jgi:hypothetical protein
MLRPRREGSVAIPQKQRKRRGFQNIRFVFVRVAVSFLAWVSQAAARRPCCFRQPIRAWTVPPVCPLTNTTSSCSINPPATDGNASSEGHQTVRLGPSPARCAAAISRLPRGPQVISRSTPQAVTMASPIRCSQSHVSPVSGSPNTATRRPADSDSRRARRAASDDSASAWHVSSITVKPGCRCNRHRAGSGLATRQRLGDLVPRQIHPPADRTGGQRRVQMVPSPERNAQMGVPSTRNDNLRTSNLTCSAITSQ